MIDRLEWDSKFFKKKIGRLTSVPSPKKLKLIIQQARNSGYSYLSCRVLAKKMSEIQRLEDNGFYITDIGTTLERKTDQEILLKEHARKATIKATIKDIAILKRITKGLFKDSRFYNDPFFTFEEADRFFQIWVQNSLQDKTTITFLIENCGFVTCKKTSKNKGDILLVGVIPTKQGKGMGQSLIYKSLAWFKEQGVKVVNVRTQANNIKAMNFYMGLGFKIRNVDVTMGLILDRIKKDH